MNTVDENMFYEYVSEFVSSYYESTTRNNCLCYQAMFDNEDVLVEVNNQDVSDQFLCFMAGEGFGDGTEMWHDEDHECIHFI